MVKRSLRSRWLSLEEAAEEFGTTLEVISEGVAIGVFLVCIIRRRRVIARSEIDRVKRSLEARRAR